jgi:hypothetical protein
MALINTRAEWRWCRRCGPSSQPARHHHQVPVSGIVRAPFRLSEGRKGKIRERRRCQQTPESQQIPQTPPPRPPPTAAHQRTAPLSDVPTTLTPAPYTPPALPAARAPPAQLFPAPAQRTQPPRSVISPPHRQPNRSDRPPAPPADLAGDPENPPQARPCIPSPWHTPRNRPRTPTAALTGLQVATAPQRPSCCAGPPPPRLSSRASAHRPPTPAVARHSAAL